MKRSWKVFMQFRRQKFTNIPNVENSSRFVICGDIDIYKSIIMVLTLSPPQIPTDAGICHTFNGRPLDQLLRSTSWFTAFK